MFVLVSVICLNNLKKQLQILRAVVVGEKGEEMEKELVRQWMRILRQDLGCFIRINEKTKKREFSWISELFELPKKDIDGKFMSKDGVLVKVNVSPDVYASVKEKPAETASELEKWGETADIILSAKFYKRPIICVNSSNSAATIYHPDDKNYDVNV